MRIMQKQNITLKRNGKTAVGNDMYEINAMQLTFMSPVFLSSSYFTLLPLGISMTWKVKIAINFDRVCLCAEFFFCCSFSLFILKKKNEIAIVATHDRNDKNSTAAG